MKIVVFGATGSLGGECLRQTVDAGHDVSVLARSPSKLPAELREKLTVVEGDALKAADVAAVLAGGPEGILFAIGVDKHSPEDLCTDVTRHILEAMAQRGVGRLVWCGGGSTIVEDDRVSFGSKFVEFFSQTFMGLRHRDKAHQLELLHAHTNVEWVGVRPLQMRKGPKRGDYRVGFHSFSGLSSISFADCADAMIQMLNDDSWLHKAPIVQY